MKSPLKFQQLNSETFPRSVQVGSTGSENLTGTLLGNVSCMTTQNKAVETAV